MNPDPSNPPDVETALEAAYAKLRRIAQKLMNNERDGHTLSATDVVDEALARLLNTGHALPTDGASAVEFITHAARAMTEVLIDYSRKHQAQKRGSGKRRVRLDDLNDVEATLSDKPDFDFAALQEAMTALSGVSPRGHRVIVLRFFGGLDNRQIARQLGVDERTVGRDFSAARLWLKERLAGTQ
jgi:RNA polymerase sigma factor (TIGR02999 family)